MPVYNEEACVEAAVDEIRTFVLDAVNDSRLIIVDDGSKDRTGEILDHLALADGRITVVHQPNSGHGGAVRAGLNQATGQFLFLVDSDRQIPLEAFANFWKEAAEFDLVMGVRTNRQDPRSRLILTKIVRTFVTLLFGVTCKDANVPFKLLKRPLWESAREIIPPDTLAPSLFLAIFALKRPYRVLEIEVPHRVRASGVSAIRHVKLLKFCAKAFGQLITFRQRLFDERL